MDGSLLHYVVVHEIDKKKDKIVIADPGKGLVTYTSEEFFKLWTGVLILMTPTSNFEKGDETISIFRRFFCIHFIINIL